MLDEWRGGKEKARTTLLDQFQFKERWGNGAAMYSMRDLFDYYGISGAVMQIMSRRQVRVFLSFDIRSSADDWIRCAGMDGSTKFRFA